MGVIRKNAKTAPSGVSADGAESAAQRSADQLDRPDYPQGSGEDGRLRMAEVVAGPAGARRVRTALASDA
jgi:hypothetical protein